MFFHNVILMYQKQMNNATCSCCSGCVWTEGSERHSESPQKLKLHNLFWRSKKPLRVLMALYLFIFHFLFSLVLFEGFLCWASGVFFIIFWHFLDQISLKTESILSWNKFLVREICGQHHHCSLLSSGLSGCLKIDIWKIFKQTPERKRQITKSITSLSLVNIHYDVFLGWLVVLVGWFVWVCWLLGLVGYLVCMHGWFGWLVWLVWFVGLVGLVGLVGWFALVGWFGWFGLLVWFG